MSKPSWPTYPSAIFELLALVRPRPIPLDDVPPSLANAAKVCEMEGLVCCCMTSYLLRGTVYTLRNGVVHIGLTVKGDGVLAAHELATTETESESREQGLEDRAINIVVKHKGAISKREIAQLLGCHEKSLAPNRCPRLDAALQAYRDMFDKPRGTKDCDGTLEAWDEG